MRGDIRVLFPAFRWRWTEDHERCQRFDPYAVEIPGRYGSVYLHGTESGVRLQAHTRRRLIRGRLAALPGVRVHQWGDGEATFTFGPEDAEPVMAILRSYRRPRKPAVSGTAASVGAAAEGA